MPSFGITPVSGFPLPDSNAFPEFIQFQNSGADLGANDADTVNFAGGLTATRGTGANSGVVTVVAGAQAAAPLTWRTSAGSTTLVLGDAENGIAMTNGGSVTVPPHSAVPFPDGTSILLYDEGYMSPFSVVEGAGVEVNVRDALLPNSAGMFAAVSLIQRGFDNWFLAGDLGNA